MATQGAKGSLIWRVSRILQRYIVAGVWVYYTLLFLWALGYFVTGDRYPAFVILNTLALYLFVPVPLAGLVAIFIRRRELWLGLGASIILFGILWGRLFIPRGRKAGDESVLTVMSYNVRGPNQNVAALIEVIRNEEADVVFLQEVNYRLAQAIEEELGEMYPHRLLDPYNDVRGMGIISKLPIHLSGESLPLKWVGTPQIVITEWGGKQITLVNFHMWATGLGPLEYIELNARAREAHALYLVDFAQVAARKGPVVVAGDANATPLSDTYRMIAERLGDSWVEAGYGFGHTFPGSNMSGSTVPRIYGIPVPRWLFRIDYVFHSLHLETVGARMAPFDRVSDHRAVVVTFVLRD